MVCWIVVGSGRLGAFAAVLVGAVEVEVVLDEDGAADVDAASVGDVEGTEDDVGEFFLLAGELEVWLVAGAVEGAVACGFPELGDFAVDVGGPDGEVFDFGAGVVFLVPAVGFGVCVNIMGLGVEVGDEAFIEFGVVGYFGSVMPISFSFSCSPLSTASRRL